MERFVERERFRATAYRAANWLAVGTSTGRTRQDRFTSLQTPLKDIYVYPLRRDFRVRLAGEISRDQSRHIDQHRWRRGLAGERTYFGGHLILRQDTGRIWAEKYCR